MNLGNGIKNDRNFINIYLIFIVCFIGLNCNKIVLIMKYLLDCFKNFCSFLFFF